MPAPRPDAERYPRIQQRFPKMLGNPDPKAGLAAVEHAIKEIEALLSEFHNLAKSYRATERWRKLRTPSAGVQDTPGEIRLSGPDDLTPAQFRHLMRQLRT